MSAPSGEAAPAEEKPRIGIFVCHCGVNIAGLLGVEDVTEYAKTLPGVVFATRNLYTCAEDGIQDIKEAIRNTTSTGSLSPPAPPALTSPSSARHARRPG